MLVMINLSGYNIDELSKERILDLISLKKNKELKEGFYSEVYYLRNNQGKAQAFRFLRYNNEFYLVVFPLERKMGWFYSKERISFHDNELQNKLTIPKALFIEVIEKEEANLNLSVEQLDLLAQGKSITISVSNKSSQNSKTNHTESTSFKDYEISKVKSIQTYSLKFDFTYFLGKNDVALKKESKNNINIKGYGI